VDNSISDMVSGETPIFITRLVADSGCTMVGGRARAARVGVTVATRSCTSAAASNLRLVPRHADQDP
jgi:hypothetical protein